MTATITAMSIAGALSVSASQTPQTPTGSQPTPQTRTEPQTGRTGSEQTITVTGCVMQAGDAMRASGAAGAAGSTRETGATTATADASKFMLSNAKMSSESATSALGNMSSVSLTGMADSELQKHLNHQVEVTGHMTAGSGMSGMSGSTGGTGSATGTTGTGSTGSATGAGSTGSGTSGQRGAGRAAGSGAMGNMPQLHATNIKMISATCAEK